jgi:hypothetical protein
LVTNLAGVPHLNLQLALITFVMQAVRRRFNRRREPGAEASDNTQRSLASTGKRSIA